MNNARVHSSVLYFLNRLEECTTVDVPVIYDNRAESINTCLYGLLRVQYRVNRCPPLDPILNQLNLMRIFTSHFIKISFSVILLPTTISFKWSVLLKCSHQNVVCIYISFHVRQCSVHLVLLYFIILIILSGDFFVIM